MSLRAFHIVFVLASIALSFCFGYWSARTPGANVFLGYLGVGLGIALLIYLPWFLKKKVSA